MLCSWLCLRPVCVSLYLMMGLIGAYHEVSKDGLCLDALGDCEEGY